MENRSKKYGKKKQTGIIRSTCWRSRDSAGTDETHDSPSLEQTENGFVESSNLNSAKIPTEALYSEC